MTLPVHLKLSVCIIVKDEELLLGQCLDSIAPFVNEIVIVDTGSQDQTVEIAKRYSASVFCFTWQNDFAAARNFAASKATQDWILFIDADEMVTAEGFQKIEAAILNSKEIAAFQLIERNYTNDTDFKAWRSTSSNDEIVEQAKGFTGFYDSTMAKLYRNHQGITWERSVHETILPSCTKLGLNFAASDVVIHHLENLKDPAFLNQKKVSYLRMVLEKLKQDPGRPAWWFEAALEFSRNGFFKQAEAAYLRAIELRKDWPEAHLNLALVRLKQNEFQSAESDLRALKKCGFLCEEVLSYLSTALLYQGKFQEALGVIQEALDLNPSLFIPHFNAGISWFELKDFHKSAAHFREVLRICPKQEFAEKSLLRISIELQKIAA